MLIRPMSGSAALAVGADLMRTYGPDSLVGRTAAVMLGSTETTFYAVSVYFGAAGVRKTRYSSGRAHRRSDRLSRRSDQHPAFSEPQRKREEFCVETILFRETIAIIYPKYRTNARNPTWNYCLT